MSKPSKRAKLLQKRKLPRQLEALAQKMAPQWKRATMRRTKQRGRSRKRRIDSAKRLVL